MVPATSGGAKPGRPGKSPKRTQAEQCILAYFPISVPAEAKFLRCISAQNFVSLWPPTRRYELVRRKYSAPIGTGGTAPRRATSVGWRANATRSFGAAVIPGGAGCSPRHSKRCPLFENIDRGIGRHEVLAMAAGLHQEFSHYCAFADAYDAINPARRAGLDPAGLKNQSWPENDALSELRAMHRERYGDIGRRAHRFTEGDYCGLFREGMNLVGRSPADDAIAAACALVYGDEFEHMLAGIGSVAQGGFSPSDWALLGELTTAQMRQRIHMRNAQFGNPLPEARIAEILTGALEPAAFDYELAARLLV